MGTAAESWPYAEVIDSGFEDDESRRLINQDAWMIDVLLVGPDDAEKRRIADGGHSSFLQGHKFSATMTYTVYPSTYPISIDANTVAVNLACILIVAGANTDERGVGEWVSSVLRSLRDNGSIDVIVAMRRSLPSHLSRSIKDLCSRFDVTAYEYEINDNASMRALALNIATDIIINKNSTVRRPIFRSGVTSFRAAATAPVSSGPDKRCGRCEIL